MDHINIILIGFMATGKTAVSELLSRKLGWKLVSTDALIEQESGKSIPEIFAQDGEETFRDLETKILRNLEKEKDLVLATGGGIVLRPENIKILKKLGKVIWLEADPLTIDRRLQNLSDRPLLNIKDKKERLKKIHEMLSFRRKKYQRAADLGIDTSKIPLEEVVQKIVDYMGYADQRGL